MMGVTGEITDISKKFDDIPLGEVKQGTALFDETSKQALEKWDLYVVQGKSQEKQRQEESPIVSREEMEAFMNREFNDDATKEIGEER